MQTWLDWYADLVLSANTQCDFGRGRGGTPHVTVRRQKKSSARPMDLLRQQFGNALNVTRQRPLGLTPGLQDMCFFQSFLLAFVKPIPLPILAASLDRDAVRGLLNEGETAQYEGVLYVDFDHNAYMLSNGFQLRALFVMPSSQTKFFAIVGRPGCNSGQRFVWSRGEDDVWVTPSTDITDGDIRYQSACAMDGRLREIENLAFRTVARVQDETLSMEQGNQNTGNAHGGGETTTRDRESRFTLFSVKRLTASNVRKHSISSGSGSAQAKRFHSVRTHMRWQACGKGRTERRRIEVPPHHRGRPENGSVTPLQVFRT